MIINKITILRSLIFFFLVFPVCAEEYLPSYTEVPVKRHVDFSKEAIIEALRESEARIIEQINTSFDNINNNLDEANENLKETIEDVNSINQDLQEINQDLEDINKTADRILILTWLCIIGLLLSWILAIWKPIKK